MNNPSSNHTSAHCGRPTTFSAPPPDGSSPADTSTIWIDVTDLESWVGPPTGIQRVVCELGSRVLARFPTRARCCAFDPALNAFTPRTADSLTHPGRAVAQTTAPGDEPGSVATEPETGIRTLRTKLARRTAMALNREGGDALASKQSTDNLFGPTDELVIIGANWLTPGYASGLTHVAKYTGVRITQVMYDLIPSLYPQWAATGASSIVTPFLTQVLPLCSTIVAISENTRRDIGLFVDTEHITIDPSTNVAVIALGADAATDALSTPPTSIDETVEFILCVGTLEIRKNQYVLYQAYREANRRGIELPMLYLVGRSGWLADTTEHALHNDPVALAKIKTLDAVSDSELSWLYEHCLFAVYPSMYEGWGLPVGEALQHGKVCLASDQASIPEVGGDLADYVSPFDASAWLVAIEHYLNLEIRTDREARIRSQFRSRSWDDVFDDFSAALALQ